VTSMLSSGSSLSTFASETNPVRLCSL
jgi:hypothetical protein